MQNDITDRQVAQAAAACALVLGPQALYAWRTPIKARFGSVDKARATCLLWPDPVQCSLFVVSLCVVIPLATLFQLARVGRLAYMPELFLAWQSVPILAAEVFLITVVVYPVYTRLVSRWPRLTILPAIMVVIHIAQISFGLWQLTQHRPELLWTAPAAIHFTYLTLALMTIFDYRIGSLWKKGGKLICFRLACWVTVSFVAFSLPIVGAIRGWDFLHLIQCVLCVAVGLEYILWKRCQSSRSRESVHLSADDSGSFWCQGPPSESA